MSELPTLWHFRVSHFNEKVRWALDWKRIPHRRRALLPGPHLPVVWWRTRQPQVPVLRIDGETMHDSTRIIAALEARHPTPPLYPADPSARARALALEEYFDDELGPHIRRFVFFHLLDFPDVAVASFAVDQPPLVQAAYRAIFPAVRAVMRSQLSIDTAHAAQSARVVEAALARVEAELGPAGHLVGNTFTIADLTAAALLVPLVLPAEFPYRLPPLVPALAAWRASLADRPAFRWAQETYRRHRGASASVDG